MTETQLAERPRRDQYRPIDDTQTIDALLRNRGVLERFRQITPSVMTPERMLRVCALAVQKTDRLRDCEPLSLLGAFMSLADLALEPNSPLGHAYLIPFKSRRKTAKGWEDYYQVQVVLGYKGLLELAYRSDMLLSCHADVVYAGDTFSYEYGSHQDLRHVMGEEQDESVKLWAYAHVHLRGGQAFEVLPYRKVMKIRDEAQSYRAAFHARQEAERDPAKEGWRLRTWQECPWVKYEHEMVQKTMLRRVCKGLRMSPEYARAADLDDRGDRVGPGAIDFARIAREPEALGEFAPAMPVADIEPERPAPDVATISVPSSAGGMRQRAAEDVKQRLEAMEAAREAAAFLLAVPPDWGILPFDDISDFPKAYAGEAQQAAKEFGAAALAEFVTRNQPALDAWAKANPDQVVVLNREINALRAGTAPPAFHLTVPPDWLALPFDDADDFMPAYLGEATQALRDHGGAALSEFLARNQPARDAWAAAHPSKGLDLERAVKALRAGTAPPLSPTAARLGS